MFIQKIIINLTDDIQHYYYDSYNEEDLIYGVVITDQHSYDICKIDFLPYTKEIIFYRQYYTNCINKFRISFTKENKKGEDEEKYSTCIDLKENLSIMNYQYEIKFDI